MTLFLHGRMVKECRIPVKEWVKIPHHVLLWFHVFYYSDNTKRHLKDKGWLQIDF